MLRWLQCHTHSNGWPNYAAPVSRSLAHQNTDFLQFPEDYEGLAGFLSQARPVST